jgi:hypothetical protein
VGSIHLPLITIAECGSGARSRGGLDPDQPFSSFARFRDLEAGIDLCRGKNLLAARAEELSEQVHGR